MEMSLCNGKSPSYGLELEIIFYSLVASVITLVLVRKPKLLASSGVLLWQMSSFLFMSFLSGDHRNMVQDSGPVSNITCRLTGDLTCSLYLGPWVPGILYTWCRSHLQK